MILKAKERGDGRQLGLYLLRDANEHVEVHELRGFASDELPSALQEIDAISRGTRASKYLFSLSLNPPAHERVPVEAFEAAADAVEQKLGLEGQPRAIIFHEKDGRRHAHVVWSRIHTGRMKVIKVGLFKLKLREVSRELYIEHGWQMPRGLANSKERDPKNYTQKEWEQAKRAKQDPKRLKELFQDCWAISDSRKAFAQALAARGYTLAQGDRRGHVAVDFRGEVYAIAKWVGVKTKQVRARLGSEKDLPTVRDAVNGMAARMTDMLRQHVAKADAAYEKKIAALSARKSEVVEHQRKERAELDAKQTKRWEKESAQRAARLSRGFRGIWDKLTGKYQMQVRMNEREALDALRRDRHEKDRLIERHLDDRRSIHAHAKQLRQAHAKEVEALHRDIAEFLRSGLRELPPVKEQFREAARDRSKGPRRDRGPEHER